MTFATKDSLSQVQGLKDKDGDSSRHSGHQVIRHGGPQFMKKNTELVKIASSHSQPKAPKVYPKPCYRCASKALIESPCKHYTACFHCITQEPRYRCGVCGVRLIPINTNSTDLFRRLRKVIPKCRDIEMRRVPQLQWYLDLDFLDDEDSDFSDEQ